MYYISNLRNISKEMFNGDIIVLNIFVRKLEQLKTNELRTQANKIEKKQLSKAGGGKKGRK